MTGWLEQMDNWCIDKSSIIQGMNSSMREELVPAWCTMHNNNMMLLCDLIISTREGHVRGQGTMCNNNMMLLCDLIISVREGHVPGHHV